MRERGRNWNISDTKILIDIVNKKFNSNERRYSEEWWSVIEATFNSENTVSLAVASLLDYKNISNNQ